MTLFAIDRGYRHPARRFHIRPGAAALTAFPGESGHRPRARAYQRRSSPPQRGHSKTQYHHNSTANHHPHHTAIEYGNRLDAYVRCDSFTLPWRRNRYYGSMLLRCTIDYNIFEVDEIVAIFLLMPRRIAFRRNVVKRLQSVEITRARVICKK